MGKGGQCRACLVKLMEQLNYSQVSSAHNRIWPNKSAHMSNTTHNSSEIKHTSPELCNFGNCIFSTRSNQKRKLENCKRIIHKDFLGLKIFLLLGIITLKKTIQYYKVS